MTTVEDCGKAETLTLPNTYILEKKKLDPSHLQKNFEKGERKSKYD